MGVHGLWDLLAPVGRRVSVETLAGKRLAIDASIWMIQFMKAMRDEKGEMVRNAHLLGFFRRICKLLYLRTKPIFIFDGGTPALKRRTVIARRRQRENAQAKIRKTAEKLLLNQLKQMRLKELANELDKQRRNNDAKGKTNEEFEKQQRKNDDKGKEFIGELENKRRNSDARGKMVIEEAEDMEPKRPGGISSYADAHHQEALDAMLAASLLVEEDEDLAAGESSSGAQIRVEEDDADEDEEMILPTMHGKVDPAILAALPPSMQLDLLVQMRERLMAENRQKYQKVKKVPARFSELQIQAYLKTVAFRREIDEVQKSAAGRGIGGVQTSRIASEANREFIFSSSFSGDKKILTSAGEGRSNSDQSPAPTANPSADAVNDVAFEKHSAASVSTEDEPQRDFGNAVETYLDEKGRVRVSRVRAMGIRMTRDLQRNLDLMKEIEEKGVATTKIANNNISVDGNIVDAPGNTVNRIQIIENNDQDGMTCVNKENEESVLNAGTSIEISIENNVDNEFGGDDDDLFAHLVAGDPVMEFSFHNSLSKKQSFDTDSGCEWEEGTTLNNNIKVDSKQHLVDGGMTDEDELEWEEGSSDIRKVDSSCPVECNKIISKGALEEEADFQEAVRRSLEDLTDKASSDASCKGEQSKAAAEMVTQRTNVGFLQEEDATRPEAPLRFNFQECESLLQEPENVKGLDSTGKRNISQTDNALDIQLAPCLGANYGEMEVVAEIACESSPNMEISMQYASAMEYPQGEAHMKSAAIVKDKDVLINEQLKHTSGSNNEVASSSGSFLGNTPINDLVSEQQIDATKIGYLQNGFQAAIDGLSSKITVTGEAPMKGSENVTDFPTELAEEEMNDYFSTEREEPVGISSSLYGKKEQIEVTEASLEEEMLVLGEEERELGDERRKLERNAESVSNEMFAEAQELLQIFGLPFIIAPMEAEAQCAYMELTNLVDGVVTDDSDAFLFGARSVYKNIFDERKYVETYFMKDIENELGLNREKLIRMALLLGSDYTEGVSGIGIVNAIEVVNAFPEEDGLRKFREWIESPDPSILGEFEVQAGGNPRKRESKVGATDLSCSDSKSVTCDENDPPVSVDEILKMKQTFMDKHRNVSKNWHIPSSFPSDAVISAYASPQVDKSTDPFSWGKPDLFVLRKLSWEKFGWSTQKADDLLLPVLKEYNKRETQLRLEAFYTFNERFAKIRSKRIKKAVKGITGNKSLHLMDESVQDGQKTKKNRRVDRADAEGDESEKTSQGQKFQDAGNETGSKPRKKRARGESLHACGSNEISSAAIESCQNQSEKVSVRGKGRGRGRGRNQSIGEQRRKSGRSLKPAESSSDYESCSDNGRGSQAGFQEQFQVRRSERLRKEVNYTVSDSKYDDFDPENGNNNENAVTEESPVDLPVGGDLAILPSKTNKNEVTERGLSWKHLEKDSRSCMDKNDTETTEIQSTSGQYDDLLSDTHVSKEYLAMGGGFCLDEDDVDTDIGVVDSSPTRKLSDSDLPNCSDSGGDESYAVKLPQSIARPTRTINRVQEAESIGREDVSDAKRELDDTANRGDNSEVAILLKSLSDNDSLNDSLRSLRAMPNLRRKRRKN